MPFGNEVDYLVNEVDDIIAQYDEAGLEHDTFDSLSDVLKAIKVRGGIVNNFGQEINIAERITEPNYRFVTYDLPAVSRETSEALATAIEIGKESAKGPHVRSLEVRKQKADDFALAMKAQIERIKLEDNISTYRDIVDALNVRGIPTSQEGGKWHLKTLQDVLKRARVLEGSMHDR